jgi:hypothetical protein
LCYFYFDDGLRQPLDVLNARFFISIPMNKPDGPNNTSERRALDGEIQSSVRSQQRNFQTESLGYVPIDQNIPPYHSQTRSTFEKSESDISGYLEIRWCGEPGTALVFLNGEMWRKWRTSATNTVKLKVPADFYESIVVRVQTEHGVVEEHASAFVQVRESAARQ